MHSDFVCVSLCSGASVHVTILRHILWIVDCNARCLICDLSHIHVWLRHNWSLEPLSVRCELGADCVAGSHVKSDVVFNDIAFGQCSHKSQFIDHVQMHLTDENACGNTDPDTHEHEHKHKHSELKILNVIDVSSILIIITVAVRFVCGWSISSPNGRV